MNQALTRAMPSGLAFVTGVGLMALVGGRAPTLVPIPTSDGGDFAVGDFRQEEFTPEFLAFCGDVPGCDPPAVTVYFTGRVEQAPAVTLDAASEAFWAGIAARFPVAKAKLCGGGE